MLSFKSFQQARRVLAGIELMQKLKKGQYGVPFSFGRTSREILAARSCGLAAIEPSAECFECQRRHEIWWRTAESPSQEVMPTVWPFRRTQAPDHSNR